MKRTLFIGLFIFLFSGVFSQTNLDSLSRKLTSNLNDTTRVNVLIDLGKAYININVDSTNQIAKRALLLAQKNTFLKGEMMSVNLLGNVEQRRGNLDTAMILYAQVRVIAEQLNDKKGLAIVHNNIGVVQTSKAEYQKALQSYLNALDYEKKIKDTVGMAEAYNNIGVVHYYMGDMENTLIYLKKSTELTKAVGDLQILKKGYMNIGAIHQYKKEYKQALDYYQRGYNIALEVNDQSDINISLHNMAQVYVQKEEYKKAEEYYLKSLAFQEKFNNPEGLAFDYFNLGDLYRAQKKYKKAEEWYFKSIEVSSKRGYLKELEMAYASLSESYSEEGRYEKAYQASLDYIGLKDSLLSEENAKNFAELRTKYETVEKEKLLAVEQSRTDSLQKVNAIVAKGKAEAELKVSNRTKWVILLIGLVLAAVLTFLLVVQRNKRKSQAEKDAAILEERDKGTQAVFEAQEEERKRISKDLHDGVGQQLSGLKMAFQQVSKNIVQENPDRSNELEKLSTILSESADEVRSISHQMMPKALTELGLIEAIEDMLHKSFQLVDIEYEFDYFGIEKRLPEPVEISLYRVAQELINNIIKHAKASKVNVQLFKNQNKVIMIVEDNGTGLVQTSKEGHGLLNIKSRVNTLKGELNLEPSPSSGTLATIRIPIG